jgi:hypothetical protein
MSETDSSSQWQDTVDMAVATLEERTGLNLAGLSQPEITQRVKEWLNAKQETKSSGWPPSFFKPRDNPYGI